MKNLVIIDYQNDFIDLEGTLNCGQDGIDIDNNISRLIGDYKDKNIFVTFDTHTLNEWSDENRSPEGTLYPAHCVINTWGHEIYGKTKEALEGVKYIPIYKNTFATNKLAKEIIERNDCSKEIEIEFAGVATNICVLQNIILLYNYLVMNNIKFKFYVHRVNVASFDRALGEQALSYMEDVLGINIK